VLYTRKVACGLAWYSHSVGVHGLSSVELVVLEICNNLLGICLSSLLELGNLVGVVLGKISLDALHVPWM
jgi:Na+/glutamate symporter